ncbi:(d)CMP kinase [Flammeovirgaceae bacterium SG7u.111]|nr:(d)CMP kinase [Flammeovirgaceae bacterium SG7u.132]WPO36902.1 (d)CMP kinase [Flammeovirgaceae bacterium SG7u.111]
MNNLIIAIDGHAGCGKSTTAKSVAKKLGYTFIDTGAMYRATTLWFMENNIDLSDEKAVATALTKIKLRFEFNAEKGFAEMILNGENVENQIRSMEVSNKVSEVSALRTVRTFLVEQQQEMGKKGGIVMDGRDIGTVVFPNADLKVFMTASIETRARRRQLELASKGKDVDLQSIIDNLGQRDEIDSSRKESPLKKAEDAIEIDTSDMTIKGQIEKVIALAKTKGA